MAWKLPANQPSEIERVDRPEIEVDVPHPKGPNTGDQPDRSSGR
jgi:hypothetical protein